MLVNIAETQVKTEASQTLLGHFPETRSAYASNLPEATFIQMQTPRGDESAVVYLGSDPRKHL